MVERLHRHLKSAIMAYEDPSHWHDFIPVILLGLRTSWKEDLGCTSAELVYGTSLRLPAGFFDASASDTPTRSVSIDFIDKLRRHFSLIKPTPSRANLTRPAVVSPDLSSAAQVFVRTDALRRSLQPPYTGPYHVLERLPKYFVLDCNGRRETISIDRLKPAFIEPPTLPLSFPLSSDSCKLTTSSHQPKHMSWSDLVASEGRATVAKKTNAATRSVRE
ncbi:uncharacterized protein LOC135384207 [Ornithodoros turicata]|uniref:uncharacterized protein LOC135384207 n=1 Tax=Ornithodoros turicata TaxID=34597 RepID=UPI00313A4A8E